MYMGFSLYCVGASTPIFFSFSFISSGVTSSRALFLSNSWSNSSIFNTLAALSFLKRGFLKQTSQLKFPNQYFSYQCLLGMPLLLKGGMVLVAAVLAGTAVTKPNLMQGAARCLDRDNISADIHTNLT
jgi:hypothetical protein